MHPGKNNQPVEKNLLKDTALLLYNITSSTIRNKIITASLAIVAIPLLILSIATGKILSSGTEQLYLERMNAELRHIDNVISGILGKAMMDLDMLCSDDAIQKRGSLLLNKYYDTKEPTDMTKVKHYGDELVIYNLMKKNDQKPSRLC